MLQLSFEVLLYSALGAALGLGTLALFAALRGDRHRSSSAALDAGNFTAALESADTSSTAQRQSLYTAAVAAKHLLLWSQAAGCLHRILKEDDDGEAWLELGLVLTYEGRYGDALRCFQRAEVVRADLQESIALHRAFALLRQGDEGPARALFEEIEVPLETKLRTDLGAGEPLFCEWFLHAAALWEASSETTKGRWARELGEQSAGDSRLPEVI